MFPSICTLLIHAIAALTLLQTASAPDANSDTPRPKREQSVPSQEQRRPRRDRFDQLRNATPEQRRQMQVDRMLDRAARTYELGDDQKPLVRAEIEKMQQERRQAMGPDAEEYDKLRERMFQFWRPPAPDQSGERPSREEMRERRRKIMNDPEFRQARERLRELDEKYPVHWEEAMKRVETLLPPEQAAKGRERIEERLAQREERTRRWQERAEQRRNRINAANSNSPAARDGERPSLPRVESPANEPPPAPPPLHPWETYVRSFIAQHDLTASQQAAAMAVLKDVRSRAARTELSLRAKIAEAEKLPDPKTRAARLAELRQPTEQMFAELKTRLDGLLTASQRSPALHP